MLDGLGHLSSSVLEVSDSITPIATMNMVSALLAENMKDIIQESIGKVSVSNTLKK